MKRNYATHTAIVGGGIAGITSAIELLDANKKVVLLDRDLEKNFGGLAKESFGGMFFINSPQQRFSGIKDSIAQAKKDWYSFAEFDENEVWGKKWADAYLESTQKIYDWVRSKKVGFFPVVHWVERGLFAPGNSVPRFHMVWGTGDGLIKALLDHLKSHPHNKNLTLYFGHKVTGFEFKDSEIVALSGVDEASGEFFECRAENFIIATGGINGNIQKVRKNWHEEWSDPPEVLLNGSHHFSDGLIHDEVTQIGGSVTNLDLMWNYAAGIPHPYPKRENHGLSLVPPKSALWVNYKGERMGPVPLVTSFDTRYLVTKICEQEKQFSWQILNKKIAYKELGVSGSEFNEGIKNKKLFSFLYSILKGNKHLIKILERDSPNYITAQSVGELAKKMNRLTGTNDVDEAILQRTIDDYDENFKRGKNIWNDEQIRRIEHTRAYKGDRKRTLKPQKLNQKRAYPLIAIREFILSRKSLGGIQTNLHSQVLKSTSKNNTPQVFENLYAVGEAAGFGGGGSHGKRALEGTFLTSCIFTALKAAQHITEKNNNEK
ncbi:FAD-dependent oxidoreductase [Flavobacteriaceae bacterium F89]|uniref:FAD-dependent oxidoreductase n=1 Tax=Cerina litoralis TaxID=2874477 RepID=A0AAE3JNL8_9FLAO|nr:FAD-dependent oxidoreductase [Cerina litoralis]MCG2460021.1 FAD-dependent oxidoreductase [Cerina litoralis]